jgi:iron(III) transport system substrate-binding protein
MLMSREQKLSDADADFVMLTTGTETVTNYIRRVRLLTAALAGITVLLATFGYDEIVKAQAPTVKSPPANATWHLEWQQTLAAAQKERELKVDLSAGSFAQYRPVIDQFGKKFGIRTVISRGDVDRLLAERSAGRFDVDIGFYARSQAVTRFIPARAFDPMAKLFFLPDLVDTTLWWGRRHVYADPEGKYLFTYAAGADSTPLEVQFNTERIAPEKMASLDSVWDIVDTRRFKGQIVSYHPEEGSFLVELAHPDIGEKWLRAFFSQDLGVVFHTDARPIVDGLAKGKFTLAVQIAGIARQLDRLAAEGARVMRWGEVRTRPVKEALILRNPAASHNFGLMNRAPNPNAAKLFVNWFLSKEGQTARHALSASATDQSLREDVTEFKMVPEGRRRKPGAKYIAPDDPIFTKDLAAKEARVLEIWKEVRGR